jgi:hypothetical protein
VGAWYESRRVLSNEDRLPPGFKQDGRIARRPLFVIVYLML